MQCMLLPSRLLQGLWAPADSVSSGGLSAQEGDQGWPLQWESRAVLTERQALLWVGPVTS